MRKLTIIRDGCGGTVPLSVRETRKTVHYILPTGTEIAVADAVAEQAVRQYSCRIGYFIHDESELSGLPTDSIADGSYAFIMETQELKFLSGGRWCPEDTPSEGAVYNRTVEADEWLDSSAHDPDFTHYTTDTTEVITGIPAGTHVTVTFGETRYDLTTLPNQRGDFYVEKSGLFAVTSSGSDGTEIRAVFDSAPTDAFEVKIELGGNGEDDD